jgi:hypothetical protein
MSSAKLHGGAVMALVDILVDVLDSLDRTDGLHIDMTPVLPDKILVVTDDPSVVNLISVVLASVNGLPSVKTSCPGIRVFCDGGTLIKRLWKSFSAFVTIHTGRVLVLSTTGTMDHELFDELKQLRTVDRKL